MGKIIDSKDAECYFIDYKFVSKHNLSGFIEKVKLGGLNLDRNMFVISTCLRYEIYNFSGKEWKFENKNMFVHISGNLCLRRFISLLCGLQSEIIGEREIFVQIRSAVYEAAKNNMLDKAVFWHIVSLFEKAEKVRNTHSIDCQENYSTVGAKVLDKEITSPANVAIIGGGYMAESFLNNINATKLKKVYWINRSVEKIKKIARKQHIIPIELFEFYNLENAEPVINKADFVFAAAYNCGGRFSKIHLNDTNCVVDVSYPSLFSDDIGCNFYSIDNTYFEKLIESPISKSLVFSAEKEIDSLIL
ncbi:MAG: hypothetical protein Athens101410_610 [Parcubacteria group bacterium Athens1014_10]|nr:MAG: hypothetical protein Athens101410_610 [Parcubacteria group bacterium Athens1014_10]TSD04796.1 MAG: hypothetical protein Athens071412_580 [Parcubacteria group bacterium Athens0714_12]